MRKLANLAIILWLTGCGGNTQVSEGPPGKLEGPLTVADYENDYMSYKGVGPIATLDLNEQIDTELADKGASLFESKCSACHKMGKKFIGPDLTEVEKRRSPEWIMNMILNPEQMVQEDPIAKLVLVENNGSPMANQNLTEEEARAVLEYFRSIEPSN